MKVLILLILFFGCISLPMVMGQRIISLKSGQKITLNNDGSYHKTKVSDVSDAQIDGEDTDAKVDQNYLLKKAAFNVLEKVKNKEIDQFILTEMLEKELSARQLIVTQNIQLNNKKEMAKALKEVDDLKSKIKILDKLYQNASLKVIKCQKIMSDSGTINLKQLKTLAIEFNVDINPYLKQNTKSDVKEIKKTTSVKIKNEKTSNPNCKILKNGDQSFYAEYDSFFNFTPEKLKTHFKSTDLLNATVSVKKVKNDYLLSLKISITSKQAASNYGLVHSGNLLNLNFISGNTLNLKAFKDVIGYLEAYTGNYIYEVEYKLDKDALRTLQKSPIDKLGIMWSSGFEQYDIYNVDVIMNQIDCLQSI